jgi:DNA-damage-inducible protein J
LPACDANVSSLPAICQETVKTYSLVRIVLAKVAKEKALPFEMRVPNRLTAETLAKSERSDDVHHAKDAKDLFAQLGI